MSLDAIGIVCEDIEKSIEFYNAFGIEFKAYGEGHYEGTTASGLRLMLDSLKLIQEINADWKQVSGGNIVICFKQNTSDEVNRLFSKLEGLGAQVVKKPWDAYWGQRYSSILDPSGNQVDIFSPL